MRAIRPCQLPADALLSRYAVAGAYADCYVTEIAKSVSQAEFVEAFYTTALFKLERLLLRTLVARPSTDTQARQLARGELGAFAAWTVEDRRPNQLLLSDLTGRTKSWLMVAVPIDASSTHTRLFFGSAVVPTRSKTSGQVSLGFVFKALLGFHKLYSRLLLRAALRRLSR